MDAGHTREALWRFSGLFGSAWKDGLFLGEVTEVSGAVEIGRIEVPLVGKIRTGYKLGRETREGTMRVQKIDAHWERMIYDLIQYRRNPDRANPKISTFDLQLRYDDPDAAGEEVVAIYGVQIWRLPIGFSMGDDIVEREYPITWEREEPIKMFEAVVQSGAGGDAEVSANYWIDKLTG